VIVMRRFKRFPGKVDVKSLYEEYKHHIGGTCTRINGTHVCEYWNEEFNPVIGKYFGAPHYHIYDCRYGKDKKKPLCKLLTFGYRYPPDDFDKLYVDVLRVEPKGRGYGSSLFNQLERYFTKVRNINKFALHSVLPARPFWEKMGFKLISQNPCNEEEKWAEDPERQWWIFNYCYPAYEKPAVPAAFKWYRKPKYHPVTEKGIREMLGARAR